MIALAPIVWRRQLTPTSCGQACVAMLLGVPVERVVLDMGSAGSTTTKALAMLLRQYGWACSGRLQRVRHGTQWPDLAICKLAFRDRRTGWVHPTWHWVLWAQERFWDPDPQVDPGGQPYPPVYGEITSYMPVYVAAGMRAA